MQGERSRDGRFFLDVSSVIPIVISAQKNTEQKQHAQVVTGIAQKFLDCPVSISDLVRIMHIPEDLKRLIGGSAYGPHGPIFGTITQSCELAIIGNLQGAADLQPPQPSA